MGKEAFEMHTCSLEMAGGYHGHPYPQKFEYADKSQFPGKPIAHAGKEMPNTEALKITMGR
jgi:hypothetical protein